MGVTSRQAAVSCLAGLMLLLVNVLVLPPAESQEVVFYTFAYLGFNIKSSPFSNSDARRGVMTAVDRSKTAGATYGPVSWPAPATGFIPPGCIGYNRAAQMPGPDIQKAGELLSRAGVRAADMGEISLWVQQGDPVGGGMAVAENLRALGLRLVIKEYSDFGAFRRTITTPAVHMYFLRVLTDACRRVTVLEQLMHSKGIGNLSGYANPEIDGLIDRARGAPDAGTRDRLYAEAEQRALDEAVLVPLWWEGLPNKTYRTTAQATDRGITVRVAQVSLRGYRGEVSLTIENGTDSEANLTTTQLEARIVDEWGNAEPLELLHSTLPDRISARGSATGILVFEHGRVSTRKLLLVLPRVRVGEQEISFQIDISPP